MIDRNFKDRLLNLFKELCMKANVGSTERTLRIIAGIVIIAIGVYYGSWWGVVGLVPLFTGLFRFCPLYTMLGMNTCKS